MRFSTRPKFTLDDFLTLSGAISLLLAGRRDSRKALLQLILGGAVIAEEEPLLEAITCLRNGYGDRRRKTGPLSILHLFRTAAYLARSMGQPTTLDLLAALLHDVGEDLTREELGEESWDQLQRDLAALRARIDEDHQWFLGERIALLTRRHDQTYISYLAQLVANARGMPDLIHAKLSDRIDSTFDLSVEHPSAKERDFFETAFDVLFLPTHDLARWPRETSFDEDIEALLLSQLFKNTVFLSLLRMQKLDTLDNATSHLFESLAEVSRSQAQRVAQEVLVHSVPNQEARRSLLRQTMQYCSTGGIRGITEAQRGGLLDGVFLSRFAIKDDLVRKQELAAICEDKPLLAQLLVCFVAIFSSFLHDPDYHLKGIGLEGLRASES